MKIKASNKISLFTLIMVTSAFSTSVRNLPTIAEMGLKMIFFGAIAALCFYIPAALVSAELATGWPKQGGIYVWVKQAFGNKMGFVAIWLQWFYTTISVIAMLYFISASLAFAFAPHLAANRVYLISASLIILWSLTFLTMKGLKVSSAISTIGFLVGVLFPAVLIIFFGILYPLMGNKMAIDFSFTKGNLFPDFKQFTTLVLLIGFMRAFAGIEASSTHANKVQNPQKNYPIAIFIVVLIGLAVNIIGSLSVAVVVPREEISLVAGVMEAFTVFFKQFHLLWLVPVLGVAVAIGQMGGLATWLLGPVKGLLSTAESGDLPPFFQKINAKGIPRNLLIVQGIWVSILCSVLMLMKTINIAFWFSVAFSMMIYVTMYFLMFLSGLRLRYKEPEVPRGYKVPIKNVGMWVIALVGMAAMLLSFVIAFFPPVELPEGNKTLYTTMLSVGILIVFALPFIVMKCKNPSWVPVTREESEGE